MQKQTNLQGLQMKSDKLLGNSKRVENKYFKTILNNKILQILACRYLQIQNFL